LAETNKAVVFQVGKEEYAIPVEFVISIEKMDSITPIPNLPGYVKGIVEVRGEIIPVIDFEHILYRRELVEGDTSRLIVLKTDVLEMAVLVNEAKEIVDIPPDKLKQVGLISGTSYFAGIANLDHRLMTVINPSTLVQSLDGLKEIKDYMESRR
jgi:purine-binding chemotaxis protein CheW